MRHIFLFLVSLLVAQTVFSQAFIRLGQPSSSKNNVSSAKQFITGATCKTCAVTINGENIKVYSSGAFGKELSLNQGDSSFEIVSTGGGKTEKKIISYNYTQPEKEKATTAVEITSIKSSPAGNLVLSPGDKVDFIVKALPDSKVEIEGLKTMLYEIPTSETAGIAGIYKGSYTILPTDEINSEKYIVSLTTKTGQKASKAMSSSISTLSPLASNMVKTVGELAFLEFGLGEDRLGGSKIGYLVKDIPLKVVGKVGSDYKVQLSKSRTAYIPQESVQLLPKGTPVAESLTSNWRVYGDEKYDYVTISLSEKLAYQSFQMVNPSKIIVDVFGAVNNSNWIVQLQSAKEVKSVDYQQTEDGVYRVTIDLIHAQHWGHKIYYNGSNLIIRIKQQPKDLSLSKLTIAIDAGHGGSNTGAYGVTGSSEKALALDMALKVQKLLLAKGAKVLMTRTTETTVANNDRILKFRENEPDLLISLHLNSAGDPFKAGGTSTFYKYVGFRNLSNSIVKRMLELGLREYGNIGSFNFMLNSPIEYPNALVEMLFLSNLEEEAQMIEEDFRTRMAEKIVMGIEDFLREVK